MDKSLKHLSRLDLLELMVKLSEENDAITAENAQLKQALAAKPTMSRAAKVGSIAELALQANGFFEAAQHAADDYLREIKRMHDQVAARTAAGNQAAAAPANAAQGQTPNANAAMGNAQAQAQAQAILTRANSQAEAIVTDARKKAEAMLTDASRQSRSIISRANHQADAVIQAARSDAQQQVARANERRQSAASASASIASTPRGRHARPAEGGQ
ncbi:MAG: hypothetical protein IJ111_05965 [Eggerthellaceae bacterium]|nr:hypothetical protein [Eggerthellaceae bacterium]